MILLFIFVTSVIILIVLCGIHMFIEDFVISDYDKNNKITVWTTVPIILISQILFITFCILALAGSDVYMQASERIIDIFG